MVPHLISALTGPLGELEQRILDTHPAIERWFRQEWMEHAPPFYSSVDLRNSDFKLAPVDTNLFPGGWNHLSADMLPLAVQATKAALEKVCTENQNLLVIPENGRTDLANLAQLVHILQQAGLHVRIGSIDPDIKEPTEQPCEPQGSSLLFEPVLRQGNRLVLPNFDPGAILLNSDLSTGIPGILEDLQEQVLLPPLHAGWTQRRKSRHFHHYEDAAKRFSKLVGVDAWLLYAFSQGCGKIEPEQPDSIEKLKTHVDNLLTKTRRKYKEYGIHEKPFAVLKNDHGTHGRGTMVVRDARDIDNLLSSPLRQRLQELEQTQRSPQWLIQEGVPSCERIQQHTAEPVVYLMDRYVVGAYYRSHAQCGPSENLNLPDAICTPMPLAHNADSEPNRFYMYGVISRLSMLAASYELEATDPNAERY